MTFSSLHERNALTDCGIDSLKTANYDYDVDVDGICRNYKVKDFSPTGAARTVSFDLARIYR